MRGGSARSYSYTRVLVGADRIFNFLRKTTALKMKMNGTQIEEHAISHQSDFSPLFISANFQYNNNSLLSRLIYLYR